MVYQDTISHSSSCAPSFSFPSLSSNVHQSLLQPTTSSCTFPTSILFLLFTSYSRYPPPLDTDAMAEQRAAPLRLGTVAPNFTADTTKGPIDLHEYIGDGWVVFFSHPEDYTPVCTTELGEMARLEPEFNKRGVKLLGLSANTVDSHEGWASDIKEISGNTLNFPIVADKERKVAYLYDMLDYQDTTNVDEKGIAFTIRSVFVIDPKKTIRTILSYPASTGRNSAEILRIVDSLQTGDKNKITTPVNWVPGDDVIVHPSVKNEQAKELFPDFRIVKPYLRFTPLAKEKATAGK
ncbi:Mitochondrial peroxiredoxin PRX1 [Cytospora mali]|uniref:Mitochondrial peroxiredoxin PRX1 n=2 Tax=Cytospora mali TaxID=578113 RepID=A0A194VJI7_CYTMA|nr:Mitochondrial peroxiredoxin PRX1 [Valsa mali]